MPLLAFLLFTMSAVPALAADDALDSALAVMGITRADFRVDPEVMLTRAGTAHKLSVFEQWFRHPLRIPSWERNWREAMLTAEGKLHPLFNNCAALIGQGTRRDLIPPTPLDKYRSRAKEKDALRAAILALDRSARIRGLSDVPPPLQESAAMLLLAAADALEWRRIALRHVPQQEWPALFAALSAPLERSTRDPARDTEPAFPHDFEQFYAQQDALSRVDWSLMMAAGDDLTAVVDTVAAELAALSARYPFEFHCRTRYGDIILSGDGNSSYPGDRPLLLVVDIGGDDLYRGGAGTFSAAHPVSIVIDASGSDRYEAAGGRPAFGGAVLGFAILTDVSGHDTYASPGFYTQGAAVAGVGLLRDISGNDSYYAIGGAQGFGMFGVGILSDEEGDDTYHAYTESQACGMTLGFGLLCDLSGNDRYTANDTDIIFPSPQSAEHNASMCQGAGYGPRRDYIDAHSLAGGIGMLLDRTGNDIYTGGVFSQAVGYWYGIGILDDRSGDDQYSAVWYGQSAAAHMGLSYLNDGGGSDLYTSTMSVTAGAAHDLSTSIFVDEAGDDTYRQAGNSLGRSLNSSVALFADLHGNDSYTGTDAFGQSVNFSSSGWRAETWTTAVFLDLGGSDTYSDGRARANSPWVQQQAQPLPLLRGAGLDADKLPLKWD